MPRNGSRRRLLAEMNVVPYIDVMLVLVVILMVDFPQLVSTVESLRADGANVPVVIAADKTVAYEKVIDVMRNLQKANITRIGLSLKLEGSGAK